MLALQWTAGTIAQPKGAMAGSQYQSQPRYNSYLTSIILYPTVMDRNNVRNTRFSFLYAICPTYHGGIYDR